MPFCFSLRMDCGCLGLHDFKNMREVITVQDYVYAFLYPVRHLYRTDHVGPRITAFGMFRVTCTWRDFFFSVLHWLYKKPSITVHIQHCSELKHGHRVLQHVIEKNLHLVCFFYALRFLLAFHYEY